MRLGPRPLPTLEARCAGHYPASDRERGETYHGERRVAVGPVDGSRVIASVRGSRPQPYQVGLDWSRAEVGVLRSTCDCPQFEGTGFCKHVWAVVLALDESGISPRVPGETPLLLLRGSASDLLRPPAASAGPAPRARAPRPAAPPPHWPPATGPRPVPAPRPAFPSSGPPATASWRQRLAGLARTLEDVERRRAENRPVAAGGEVWYLIDLDGCVAHGGLVLALFHRVPRRRGSEMLGNPRPLVLDRRLTEVGELGEAADRDLLPLLAGLPFPAASAVSPGWTPPPLVAGPRRAIPPALFDRLLPALCATGRCGWWPGGMAIPSLDHVLAWDGPLPWQLALRVDRDAGRRTLLLRGELVRGEERRALSAPVLLLSAGVIVFADRLGRLEAGAHFPWLVALRQAGEVRAPAAEADELLEALWGLPRLPHLELPPDLAPREEHPPLARCLSLAPAPPPARGLLARASFAYGDLAVEPDEGRPALFDAATRRVVHRDLAGEAAALAELEAAGLPLSAETPEAAVSAAGGGPVALVEGLLAAGWEVRWAGARVRAAGSVRLSVRSGVDWLDLGGGLDFGDQEVALPAVLAALRRGERLVPLADGGRGLLPPEWAERLAALAHLAGGEEGPGLRFSRAQAPLLDALLAAVPEADLDAAFRRLRKRLEGGAEVAPATASRGFAGELRPYQRLGLGWLKFLEDVGFGGCLADDMGLGKTIQVLAHLEARRGRRAVRGGRRPTLVVAPRSLVYNWIEEAARFAPRLRSCDYTGIARPPLAVAAAGHDLVVTTYGTLRRDVEQFREVRFGYAVFDEAQAVKNPATLSAKACRVVAADHRLALTGTPVENHLGDLWSLLDLLNPGMLGRLSDLSRRPAGAAVAGEELAVLARAVRPFLLRRTKEQVLPELPPVSEQTIHCTLEGRQRQLYEQLRRAYRASLGRRIREVGVARSRIQILEALLRLRQAACHPGLVDPERTGERSAKLDALFDRLAELREEGHRALVFSQFTRLLALVRSGLDERGIRYAYLDGHTRDRKARVEAFQGDPDCSAFLISLKAGGTGLNLTAAEYVFLLDPWWNPAVEAQAVGRSHRIGQRRSVFAYRLIARDTVEEKILELQKGKRRLAEAILEPEESLARKLTAADLEILLG